MYEFLHNAGAYIIAISVLVAFHEYGHFWAARRVGVRVLRFSIGFGKPLWRRVGADGVEYVIAAIPFGGYVKLLDEREGPVPVSQLDEAFNRKPAWARIFTFAAGPAFNFVLAVAFYWATFVIGIPSIKPMLAQPPEGSLAAAAGIKDGNSVVSLNGEPIADWDRLGADLMSAALDRESLQLVIQDASGAQRVVSLDTSTLRLEPRYMLHDLGLTPYQPAIPPVIGGFVEGSVGQKAGLQIDDRIVAVNDIQVQSFQELQRYIAARPGQQVHLQVQRGSGPQAIDVTLATDIAGHTVVGRLGVKPSSVANTEKLWQDLQIVERLSPIAAFAEAVREIQRDTVLVLKLLWHMVIGDLSVKNLSGPISTAEAAGFAASVGLTTFLHFIAFVSLNVGIVNLLPLPVLDGGQIVNSLVEMIKGSPLSDRTMIVMQQIGFALLILIMGFVFYNDLARVIG
jgi:regulator of sigma E protease